MRRKLISVMLVGLLLLSACSEGIDTYVVKENYENAFVSLSEEINKLDLPLVDPESIANTENFLRFVDGMNKISGIINKKTDYEIPLLKVTKETSENIVKKADFLVRFAPIIEPYNDVIIKSKKVDPDIPSSINTFSTSVGFFVFDVFVLQLHLLSKTSIYTAKYLWDYAKLGGLISKENLAAFLAYTGDEGKRILRDKVIPFIINNTKNVEGS